MDLDEWARQGYPEIEIRRREREGRRWHPPVLDYRELDAAPRRVERQVLRWVKPPWYARLWSWFSRRGGSV